MKIFSKKAYKFEIGGQEPFIVKPLSFITAPEWIKNTLLFKLAVKDGSIQVIASKEQQINIENGDPELTEKQLREKGKELKIPNYAKLALPTLKKKIEEIELKLTQPEKVGDDIGGGTSD